MAILGKAICAHWPKNLAVFRTSFSITKSLTKDSSFSMMCSGSACRNVLLAGPPGGQWALIILLTFEISSSCRDILQENLLSHKCLLKNKFALASEKKSWHAHSCSYTSALAFETNVEVLHMHTADCCVMSTSLPPSMQLANKVSLKSFYIRYSKKKTLICKKKPLICKIKRPLFEEKKDPYL